MKKGKHDRDSRSSTWWNYCPTNKTRYASAKTANRRLGQIAERPRTVVSPTHFFHCDLCSGWHLTSDPGPGAYPYRADLDERWAEVEEARRAAAADAAARIASAPIVIESGPEPEPEPEPEGEELFSADEGVEWIVASYVNGALDAFNDYYGTELTMRMFTPMVGDALKRVRDRNKEGAFCADMDDPRHDGETCPTQHTESE